MRRARTSATPLTATMPSAGTALALHCELPWVARRMIEGADGTLAAPRADVGLRCVVEADRRAFDTDGWTPITRDAYARDGTVVLRDVATSGFDLHVEVERGVPTFTYRWRPPTRDRAAAVALPGRSRLLVRAVLLQYPALWVAGLAGRAPLHATALEAGPGGPVLLAGPSGAGKTSLVLAEVDHGARTLGDNLSVTDGRRVWGVTEPIRSDGGGGRRSTHGRRESHLARRLDRLTPTTLVVLERASASAVVPCDPEQAARTLVAATYAAGELRRYWTFHAVVAMGTGLGTAHPPVAALARELSSALRCVTLRLHAPAGLRLPDALAGEVATCS